jgi:hypothetical protein
MGLGTRYSARFAGAFLSVATPILVLVCAPSSSADEIKLKDGTKISGTIVGFEDSSFKVKTNYGFAVVQKDQVVSISMADASAAVADKKAESTGVASDAAKASAPPAFVASKPLPPASPVHYTVPAAPVVAALGPSKLPALMASAEQPAPPEVGPIKEQVTGNSYTNETYRFRMYKPPGWEVIGSAPSVLPGAIAAMGTGDQTTYLLIGQGPAGKTLAADAATAEKRLRDVMENFRPLGEQQITVSGAPAVEHRFRGSVDQHDWSGVVVVVPRGGQLYTIFGMTRADNDLVQIQENIISRAIASLQFTE